MSYGRGQLLIENKMGKRNLLIFSGKNMRKGSFLIFPGRNGGIRMDGGLGSAIIGKIRRQKE